MEKKKPSKPTFSIFETAIKETKGKSAAKNKEIVNVKGLETKLLEFEFLKDEMADTKAKLSVVQDEIKQISKEKFVELYKQKKRNPNTFYLKDGEGCVMVIPMDKYTDIKEQERAEDLIDKYGEDAVTIQRNFYLNPDVLERNRAVIEKLIYEAKNISETDKRNLLVEQVTYTVRKGFIDDLLPYGNKMENVLDDIQPTIALKSCGGTMADGGISDDGELISYVYDDYDAEVGSSVSSMYAKGGKVELIVHGKSRQYSLGEFNSAKEAKKYVEESDLKQPYSIKKLMARGGMMADGGMMKYNLSFNYNPSNLKNSYAEKIVSKYTKDWKHDNDQDEVSFFVMGLTMDKAKELESELKMEDAYNFEITKSRYASGGMMARGGMIADFNVYGNYADGFQESLEEFYSLEDAVKYADEQLALNPDYINVEVIKGSRSTSEDIFDSDIVYVSERKASGGIFGDSRYNSGRSWHLDRARHNQKESYEKPLKYRKRRRYGSGGM